MDTNREHIFNPQRVALRTRRIWLATAWSAILIVLVSLNASLIWFALPNFNATTHSMALGSPRSEAYGALELNIDVRSRTGLFEYPGRTTHAKWTLAIVSAETLKQRRQTVLARIAAPVGPPGPPAPKPPPLGTLHADSLAGTATFICGDDVQHEALTAEALADWLIWLFPDADPNQIAREAEGVLETIDFHIQQNLQGAGAGLYGYWPVASFSGGSSKGISVRQRLWYPGVALVAGVILAIWGFGVGVIVRMTRVRLIKPA